LAAAAQGPLLHGPLLSNTVGAKLSNLKEGDRVTVEYAGDWTSGGSRGPANAMVLKKVG
jgi:hypothetical protein